MADLFRKYKSLFSTTSNSFNTGSDVEITLNSVTGLPTDTSITLTFDRVDSNGTELATMERITGKLSGTTFQVEARGVDGTKDQAHTTPVVEQILNAADWNDLMDALLVNYNQDGSFKDNESTQTLTNKTLTSPVINGEITGTAILDEDDMSSNSATQLATQQSIKAYVDTGYHFKQTVYFTADGTFAKADYPYLRAIKVKVQGAGGGGGGVDKTVNQAGCGGAGGGGGYSEKFILASALATSETVTVGEGGAGGAAGNNNGTAGETSSFGTHCTASGGGGGSGEASSATVTRPGAFCGNGGVGSDGDLNINGDAGVRGLNALVNDVSGSQGGGCFMSGLQAAQGVGNLHANGTDGKLYGGGGNGGLSGGSSGNDAAGGKGADGIVIVELYA